MNDLMVLKARFISKSFLLALTGSVLSLCLPRAVPEDVADVEAAVAAAGQAAVAAVVGAQLGHVVQPQLDQTVVRRRA